MACDPSRFCYDWEEVTTKEDFAYIPACFGAISLRLL